MNAPARADRSAGAIVGWAVGDALGAPFEFGLGGMFSKRFPRSGGADGNELCGGGGWDPGEATDDTQMGLLIGESLLESDGLDLPDIFARFQRWAAADPKDIGILTETVLCSRLPWNRAAREYFAHNMHAAGNGSLMRAVPAALRYARRDQATRVEAARCISALTHADPATGWGCAIYQELLITALDGRDVQAALPAVIALVDEPERARWERVLRSDWHPRLATESNGAVWPTLGTALWALRTTSTFEEALRAAVDLGGDTDTVGAVTGGLAGAVHGLPAIPTRWTELVHTPLPGFSPHPRRAADLIALARALESR
ncbi:ADP-ribosylglycohydrolase family protein [Streptacidiphilus sp. P02-A3a]|uniref:ADP-ribosylglycohydrolase family protein n=1 Tax=Streptacidiphilus sp. P02-A3a TaxID=2704468 RepID=UPI0015F98BD5|nr:ADP-ribosylglycohydrolase family protein [Streptacidiphilus sp. P02-A3a]QMU68385.1 ADP-ribosylglycohydrolase family protein [Streptacidiphilus sp. P02-A3a]